MTVMEDQVRRVLDHVPAGRPGQTAEEISRLSGLTTGQVVIALASSYAPKNVGCNGVTDPSERTYYRLRS